MNSEVIFAAFAIFTMVLMGTFVIWHAVSLTRDDRERVDHAKIHRLEYELGFREDPPPSSQQGAVNYTVSNKPREILPYRPPSNVSTMLKELYTDEPGAVIYYRPPARPEYDSGNRDYEMWMRYMKRALGDYNKP